MNFQEIIFKKRDGLELNEEEIKYLVKGIGDGSAPDYQISAWAMAVYFQGMTAEETRRLALAMAYSGDVADLSSIEGVKVDKHSTGGVGDKTTMVTIPLVAAAGVPVAKMSGRGLGHTGGTIDKFESIPGFKVEKSYSDFVTQVNKVGAAVVSQSGNLVPADKRLYAIRDVTATVDSIPLIASSVMSKKIAAGAEGIVLDVKVGSGAFMKDQSEALKLARLMVQIGQGVGRKVVAVLSDMSQPLGRTVGNALEVREAIDTLKGQGPADLEYLSLYLAAHMVQLGQKADSFQEAWNKVQQLLKDGTALSKFKEMVEAQEGRFDYEAENYGLCTAPVKFEVRSREEGYIASLDAHNIGTAAMLLGAGRARKEDIIDHAAGVELLKKKGDRVERGDILALLHTSRIELAEAAAARVQTSYQYSADRPRDDNMVLDTIM
jgi:pyrimidine-nucleoside phosphorylase